jgi:hypothetical protein
MSGNWGAPRAVRLEQGEVLLWQGAPAWRPLAQRVFHARIVAGYFLALILFDMAYVRLHHMGRLAALRAAAPGLVTGAAVLLILAALAWAVCRTTRYSLTTRRIVMQFGVALPATLEVPLHRIGEAAIRVGRDHTGDISLRLLSGDHIAYVKLWPHAKPWRLGHPEPMLRDVRGAARVVTKLCQALEGIRKVGGDVPFPPNPPSRRASTKASC